MLGKLLEKARYLAGVGVVSLLLASVAAFGWGAVKTLHVIMVIVTSYGQAPEIAIALIELVDGFLIATVLFIFAVNLYELFIDDLSLPEWMLAHNLEELKTKLSGVIILVMAVRFLEHLVEWKDPHGTLFFGIAVAVVSATLIALGHFGKKE